MSAGEIVFKLSAITADFEKKMTKATSSLNAIKNALHLNVVKQAIQMFSQFGKAVAEHSDEAKLAIDNLGRAWGSMLSEFGPAVAGFTSGILTPMVEKLKEAVQWLKEKASLAGAMAGGATPEEAYAMQQEEKRKASGFDFRTDVGGGGLSSAFTEIDRDLAEAKKKTDAYIKEHAGDWLPDFNAAADEVFEALGEAFKVNADEALKQLLKDLPDVPKRAIGDTMRERVAANQNASVRGSIQQAGGEPMAMAQRIAQAGSKGPEAAAAQVVAEMLMKSKSFIEMLSKITEALGSISESVIGVLGPAFDLVAGFMKGLAIVIGNIMLGIYKLLDLLPFVSYKKKIRALENSLWEMEHGARATTDPIEDMGEAAEGVTEKFADINVPQGVKTALARWEAQQAGVGPDMGPLGIGVTSGYAGGDAQSDYGAEADAVARRSGISDSALANAAQQQQMNSGWKGTVTNIGTVQVQGVSMLAAIKETQKIAARRAITKLGQVANTTNPLAGTMAGSF